MMQTRTRTRTTSPRQRALDAINAVVLPPGWEPLVPNREWDRWSSPHDLQVLGSLLHLAALGSSPGAVEVSCYGCSIHCMADETQAAVDHVLRWVAYAQPRRTP